MTLPEPGIAVLSTVTVFLSALPAWMALNNALRSPPPAATAARGVPERFLSSGQDSGSGGSSGDGAQSTPVESDKGRAEGGS